MMKSGRSLIEHLIAACMLPALAGSAMAQSDYFVSLFDTVDSYKLSQTSEPITTDVDGDGREDITFGVTLSGASAIFVAGNLPDGTTRLKQHIVLPNGSVLKSLLGTPTPIGPVTVAVTEQGYVRTYRGWPLVEQFQFNVGATVASAAIGDVDADGVVELVVAIPQELRIYSPETGQLLRALPVSATYGSLSLAQVDGDPALEIMAKGASPGLFVDGATLAIDLTQTDSLHGVVGGIRQNGRSLIVSRTDWAQIGTFSGIPWAITGLANLPSGLVLALAVAKLDNIGEESIVVGAGSTTYLYQPASLQFFRTLSNTRGAGSIGAVDMNGDGTRELAYFPHSQYPGGITIASSGDNTTYWSHVATAAPLTRTAIGDVDGDGQLELVAVGSVVPSPSGLGSIIVSDLLSGVEKWRAPSFSGLYDPLRLEAARVVLEPRSTGIGMDIILAGAAQRGSNVKGGQLTIIDGVTKQLTFAVGPSTQGTNPLDNRSVSDFAFADFDGDGVKDFIVGSTGFSNSTPVPPQLKVISGATGLTLFDPGPLPGGAQSVNGVLVVEQNGRSSQVVIALPDRVLAFHTRTGQPAWEWLIANDGVTLLSNPKLGDELAIHRIDGTVSIFSADTRQLRRSFTLPAPLNGLFALPGSAERFLALHGEALALINSSTGAVSSETESLGPVVEPARPPAAYQLDDHTWQIAIGSRTALYRKRLVVDELIFSDSFDSAAR